MYSLLNRLAWVVSLVLIISTMSFFDFTRELFYYFEVWALLIFVIPTMIIKKIFFSSARINEAVSQLERQINTIAIVSPDRTDISHTKTKSYTNATIPTSTVVMDIDWSEVNRTGTGLDALVEELWEDLNDDRDKFKQIEEMASQTAYIPEEPSKIGLYLHSFFSDRPLAKVGGILLFLGALFFLWLIFAAVGPVGKTLIGLAFGWVLIGIWVWMNHRDITTESRVLFGVGIAVNYLTILSGRYLLGSDAGDGVLFSESLTTIALLLNTGLAIAISLVFCSRVLLGFAFIFAYLTPFLVGSTSSSIYLLVIYTTILTVAIAVINSLYTRLAQSESVEYLQWIGIMGMMILLSLATLDANGWSVMVICASLFVSVVALSIASYRAKISLVPILIAGYVVLFASTFVSSSYFIVPLSIVVLFGIGAWLTLQSLISVASIVVFGGIAFAMSLIGFIVDGWQSIGMLFITGSMVFALLWVLMFRTASLLLGSVALIGFAALTLVGITVADPIAIDLSTILSTRAMAILLLIGASIFTIRLRDAIYLLMAIILSGILMIYPNMFEMSITITTLALSIYLLISLIVPYILMRDDQMIAHRPALLIALPVSALVITTAIYQVGHIEFPGIAMGVAYIVQAIVYLIYGMIVSSWFLSDRWVDIATLPTDSKIDLLVLFALPLSLFTLALAFVFWDLPGMMSLAWILESTILYLVYTRLGDLRIYIAACLVFLIGIVRQVVLIDSIFQRDYLTLAILAIAMVSVFASLYFIRSEKKPSRMFHDILHIFAILGIGYGVSRIIPSTSTGWSLLGISIFVLVLTNLYRSFGQLIHRQFSSVLFVLFCFVFLYRFDWLNRLEILPLLIQFTALGVMLGIGYVGYKARDTMGYIDLAIALIATLIISSLYIDHFFGVFAVSIYLTAIAAITIIRGISIDRPLLRTFGLYIGTFALIKILGYDLWQDALDAITRVIALMIAGGVMMYLSQLYGKYVSRSWQEEFSLENIVGSDSDKKDTNTDTPDITADVNPFTGDLARDLDKIDVSDISAVEFVSGTGSFTIRRSGVIRLARYITESLHKTAFAPRELASAHAYVLGYLSSNLPARDLESMLAKIEKWIQEGGSVTFIKK